MSRRALLELTRLPAIGTGGAAEQASEVREHGEHVVTALRELMGRGASAPGPAGRGIPLRSRPTLEEAFRQYAPLVAGIGLRVLGSRDQVQDLVQDVFLKAGDWIGRMDDPGAIKSWLMTVTVREARRRLRLQRLRAFYPFSDEQRYTELASPLASPVERTLTTQIYRILDGVAVDARIAWTLRYVQGLTLPEIAETCDCSLTTAKRRVAAVHHVVLEALSDD